MFLLRCLRYALRTLRQSPGFAVSAIAILALGIGANTAIFSVIYAVMLRPLPYPDSSRLVFVWQRFPGMPEPFSDHTAVAPQNYREWRRQNTVFQQIAAFRTAPLPETGGPGGKAVTTFVSANLFSLLGTEPRVGRLFHADEERADRDRVAVLSDAYFKRRFGGDAKALGQAITLDDTPYTVIGVLPAKFYLPRTMETDDQPDVLVPLPDVSQNSEDHRPLIVAARLRPGVSLAQARAEMAGIAARLEKQESAGTDLYKRGSTAVFTFAAETTDASLDQALYLLMGAVVLVLLIACANLANLTLARASVRSREITVRLALGATRGEVVVQLLSESLLLALGGAACGVLLSHWLIRLIQALKPPDIEDLNLIAINAPVLGFTIAVAALTAIVFGLGPALAASGADLASRLKIGGGWGGSAKRLRSREFLIASEVALAFILLAGAGLMIRSLQRVAAVGVGFDTSHLAAVDIELPAKRYPGAAQRVRLIRDLMARAAAIPGVASAAITTALPLHSVSMNAFHIAGRTEPSPDAAPVADVARVTPGFFQVIGLRLETGRWFTTADLGASGSGKGVVIVNRTFAAKYFGGESPLGRRLLSGDRKETLEIAGVVADYRAMGAENEARPEIFQPSLDFDNATLLVRGVGAPQTIARGLLVAARSVAPNVVADKVKAVDEYAEYWTSQRRFNTLLLGIFATLALVLAMSGIYGVLSNLVAARTREVGIRMAIGATPRAIGWLVMRQSMGPLAIGTIVGFAGCMTLGRLIESLLFQVQARDPIALGASLAAILLTSVGALWLPLRRATAVDCAVALREE